MFTCCEDPFDELGYQKVFYTDETFQPFHVDALAELLWMPYLDTLDRQVSADASSWSTLKALYDRRF